MHMNPPTAANPDGRRFSILKQDGLRISDLQVAAPQRPAPNKVAPIAERLLFLGGAGVEDGSPRRSISRKHPSGRRYQPHSVASAIGHKIPLRDSAVGHGYPQRQSTVGHGYPQRQAPCSVRKFRARSCAGARRRNESDGGLDACRDAHWLVGPRSGARLRRPATRAHPQHRATRQLQRHLVVPKVLLNSCGAQFPLRRTQSALRLRPVESCRVAKQKVSCRRAWVCARCLVALRLMACSMPAIHPSLSCPQMAKHLHSLNSALRYVVPALGTGVATKRAHGCEMGWGAKT